MKALLTTVAVLLLTATPAFAQADNPFKECPTRFHLSSLKPMVALPNGEHALSGQVIVICDGTELYADELRWNDKTISGNGNLLVVQEGLRVTADRMEMDRATRLGTFWKAFGTARLTDDQPNRDIFGTLEPEVMFRADKIERIGRRQYRMTNGWFTTCVQPEPRWVMSGSSGTITLDDSVSLRNVVFKVKRIPVLYVPYLYYPLEKEDRKTGFLIPTYSNSNIRGPGVSAAFFWAINRSQDATIYWDGYWNYGQGTGVDYRYQATHADSGNLRVNSFWEQEMVLEDGTPRPAKRTWNMVGRMNQRLGRGFQLIGDVDYFSDTVSQQLYQQGAYEFTQSSRRLNFAVIGNVNLGKVPMRLEGKYFQQDVFTGLTSGSRLGRTPEFRASVDGRTIKGAPTSLPVTVGGYAEFVHLDAKPDFNNPTADQQHWRADSRVYISAPYRGLSFVKITPSAGWRFTTWTESLDPITRLPVPVSLSRSLFDFRVDVRGPEFERVWRTPDNKYATGFKHVISPRVTTQWMTAFDSLAQVIQIDPAVDAQVGGTINVNYSLTNSILANRRTGGGATSMREIVSVGIGQTYHSNALAALSDTQYLTPTIANFQPVWLRARVSPTERVTGNFELYIHPVARAVTQYSAGTTIDATLVTLHAGWSKVESIPSVPELSNPAIESHYARAAANVRLLRGKVGVSYGFDWDIRNDLLLQQRMIANYNAQCCGFSVDYQVRGLAHLAGSGAPAVDRRWSFSVTLAGIGTFSNPFGSFRQ